MKHTVQNDSQNSIQTLDKVSNRLNWLYSSIGTWRGVAALPIFELRNGHNISPGTLCAIAKGRDPKDSEVRAVLGLPALLPAPACAKCGAVHVTKRCMAKKEISYFMASDLAEMGMM